MGSVLPLIFTQADIIRGIGGLHSVGIILGDIKPANVLIFEDFKSNLTAKIADFGSSLFRSSITKLMKVQSGTTLWQPR